MGKISNDVNYNYHWLVGGGPTMAGEVLASMSRARFVVRLCSKLLVVGGFWEVQHTNISEAFLRKIH